MIARREIETEGVGHKSSDFDIPTLKTRPPLEAPSSNLHSLHQDKRPIHTINPKCGLAAAVAFKHTTVGGSRALQEQLDTLQPKVLARSIRIALDDDGLGMLQTRQPQTILARITNTDPSPGRNVLIFPGKTSQVESHMTMLELFGRPATVPFSSRVCAEPWLM